MPRPDDRVRIQHMVEAATKVSQEVRAAAPSVPWDRIVAMRNRLIHAYFDINRDILWKTATEEIPPLAERLKRVLEKEE